MGGVRRGGPAAAGVGRRCPPARGRRDVVGCGRPLRPVPRPRRRSLSRRPERWPGQVRGRGRRLRRRARHADGTAGLPRRRCHGNTTVLRVRVTDLSRLMATSTELSDVLLSAFDARRRLLTRLGEGGLVLAGDDDRDMHRLQEFAERNHVPYRIVLRSDPSAWSEVAATCALPEQGTAVVTGRGRTLTQPTTRDLAAAVGLDLSGLPDQERCDLLIVGAGPAGLAAAVYGASEGLDVVIAEGVALGGQAGTSSRIENYLGFPRGIAGGELARSAMLQRSSSGHGSSRLGRSPDSRAPLTGSRSDSMTATTSPPGPWSSPAACSTAGSRSRVSPSSRVAACTTPRPSSKREPASVRTWSWWEAPTRPGRLRCSSRSRSTTCTSSSGATTSPRRCPAISRNGSPTTTGSPSTPGHT